MIKSRFNLRNVVKIGVACLAVCMMFVACGKDNDKDGDKDDGKGWPSAAILTKYGFDGMNKPTGFASGLVVETGGYQLVITFSGNASTAASVKSYFAGNNSWTNAGETIVGEYTITTYSKEDGGTSYFATFTEMGGNDFQLQSVKGVF